MLKSMFTACIADKLQEITLNTFKLKKVLYLTVLGYQYYNKNILLYNRYIVLNLVLSRMMNILYYFDYIL